MSGWTKGPWRTECEPRNYPECNDADLPWVVRDADGKEVVTVEESYGPNMSEPYIANARLIASAPCLYEALEAFVAGADAGLVTVEIDNAARAALRKARGEQS